MFFVERNLHRGNYPEAIAAGFEYRSEKSTYRATSTVGTSVSTTTTTRKLLKGYEITEEFLEGKDSESAVADSAVESLWKSNLIDGIDKQVQANQEEETKQAERLKIRLPGLS